MILRLKDIGSSSTVMAAQPPPAGAGAWPARLSEQLTGLGRACTPGTADTSGFPMFHVEQWRLHRAHLAPLYFESSSRRAEQRELRFSSL
jgi:hypothetical protein